MNSKMLIVICSFILISLSLFVKNSLEKSIPGVVAKELENHSNPSNFVTSTMDNELQFLNYASRLKHLDRTGWTYYNISRPETVAGHMYRMAIMSLILIEDSDSGLDMNKCIKMSLLHDFAEAIVGDITPKDGVDPNVKHQLEAQAFYKMTSLLSPQKRTELQNLYQEYEQRESPEAKFVKDLDILDLILQAYEYEERDNGAPGLLQDFFDSADGFIKKAHPTVRKLAQKLYEARKFNIPFDKD